MTDTAPGSANAAPAAPDPSLDAKIDIYKTFIDTAERSIERRMRTNQFYFSVVAALFIAYAWLAEGKLKTAAATLGANAGATSPGTTATAVLPAASLAPPLWVLPLFLLVVSVSWLMLLRSFRVLSAAKYATVNEIEADLPLRPFQRERAHYKTLGRSRATTWELIVPVLGVLTAILALAAPLL